MNVNFAFYQQIHQLSYNYIWCTCVCAMHECMFAHFICSFHLIFSIHFLFHLIFNIKLITIFTVHVHWISFVSTMQLFFICKQLLPHSSAQVYHGIFIIIDECHRHHSRLRNSVQCLITLKHSHRTNFVWLCFSLRFFSTLPVMKFNIRRKILLLFILFLLV